MFYPIADVQQKVGIRALVENILDHLDTSAYSNKELSQILDTDKSTISRKLYQLKKNELVIPKFVEWLDRLYYITNCENCPWDLTREECRSESITSLQEVFKEKYNVKLDKSIFTDITDNHILKHVSEIFEEIPVQSNIEIEKRKLMERMMQNLFNTLKDKAH